MKTHDILQERETAAVHTSLNTKLNVIASLLEKEFGVDFKKSSVSGTCLVAQVVYSIAATAKIPAKYLIDHIDKQYVKAGFAGLTLDTLFKIFSKPIKVEKDKLTVKLSLHECKNSADLISEIKSGQPVVCIARAESSYTFGPNPRTGIVKGNRKYDTFDGLDLNKSYYHALLAIGYDSEEDTVILRDSRHTYAREGYLKTRRVDIDKNNPFKMLCINVDSLTWKYSGSNLNK